MLYKRSEDMDAREAIQELELIKAEAEWEYPLDWQIVLDTAIEALKTIQKQEDEYIKECLDHGEVSVMSGNAKGLIKNAKELTKNSKPFATLELDEWETRCSEKPNSCKGYDCKGCISSGTPSYKSPCSECIRSGHDGKDNYVIEPPYEVVEPEHDAVDLIHRQDVIDLATQGILVSNGNYKSVVNAIESLPSARPKGIWTITTTDDGDGGEIPHLVCSECGGEPLAWCSKKFFKFCPNCGADMGGEEHE